LTDITQLLDVASALATFGCPWFFAGGWALDLFLGRVTREHDDIDVLVLRSDQREVRRCLTGWRLEKITPHPEGLINRGTLSPWAENEWLELPIHQIDAHREEPTLLKFQIMLAETSDGEWVYRRNTAIRRPLAKLGIDSLWALPYVAPEIVLLFKAKQMLDKDRADFRNVAPALDANSRRWLRNALEICHPGHQWLRAI
jgi:Aminoglycoside-2''-adenylyltransferase